MNVICIECLTVQHQDERHADEECDECGSAELRAVEAVEATFHPQVWHNERAVTSDDLERFIVPIEDAVDDDGQLLMDNTHESDELRNHPNAPERAREWRGPFYIALGEFIHDHRCDEYADWNWDNFVLHQGNKPATGEFPGRCRVCGRELALDVEVMGVTDVAAGEPV